jgi:aldose 1-epimerase
MYTIERNGFVCERAPFGRMPSGKEINQFNITNQNGLAIKLTNYGATLASLKVPAAGGQLVELTLGFDTLKEYLNHPFYFGCTVGRVANRIAKAAFQYQKQAFQLARNEDGLCHLHGGNKGFDKVIWDAISFRGNDAAGVEFSYTSRDNEENYPGNLKVKVTYALTSDNELKIIYTATTDRPTPVNLTNHTYWNLAGAGHGTVLDHEVEIFSDAYLPTDQHHIPSGEIKDVTGSAFDFRSARSIGERIKQVSGYDHCYVLKSSDKSLQLAARVKDPASGRVLETYTTQAGMQFYSGNSLVDYAIAEGKSTQAWGGFCLETQGFPDAVNQTNFPSIVLLPGEIYQHETVYKILTL